MENKYKHILLLLANGFEAYEASVFTDVLDWNMEAGDKSTRIVIAVYETIICRQQQLASFDVNVANQPIVIDSNIITSSPPAIGKLSSYKTINGFLRSWVWDNRKRYI